MSRKGHVKSLAAIAVVVLLVTLTAVQGVFAEGGHEAAAAPKTAAPDVSVVLKTMGGAVGWAKVFVDDKLAGTTGWNGNLTFKEKPAPGTHTVRVSKPGLDDVTVTTDFSTKPVVVSMVLNKGGRDLTIHVTDKNTKNAIEGAEIFSNKFLMGSTDASGNLAIANFPQGIYLVKLAREGYKPSTALLIVYSNKTQNFVLTPGATAAATEH